MFRALTCLVLVFSMFSQTPHFKALQSTFSSSKKTGEVDRGYGD
jgi:hypothetical protein